MNKCSTFLYLNKEVKENKEVISILWTSDGMLYGDAGPSWRTWVCPGLWWQYLRWGKVALTVESRGFLFLVCRVIYFFHREIGDMDVLGGKTGSLFSPFSLYNFLCHHPGVSEKMVCLVSIAWTIIWTRAKLFPSFNFPFYAFTILLLCPPPFYSIRSFWSGKVPCIVLSSICS